MQIQHIKLTELVHNKKVTEITCLRIIMRGIIIAVFKICYRLTFKKIHMVSAVKEIHRPREHNRRYKNDSRQLQPKNILEERSPLQQMIERNEMPIEQYKVNSRDWRECFVVKNACC